MRTRGFVLAAIGAAVAIAVACGGDAGDASTTGVDAGATSDVITPSDASTDLPDATAAAAEVIAQDLGAPWEIACDERAAYVTYETDGGKSTLYRIERGAAPAAIATDPVRGRHVAVDETRVYWVSGSAGGWSYVHALEKDADGGKKPADYFADPYGSRSFSLLTVRGGSLAYARHNGSSDEPKVMRGSTDGGDAIAIAPVAAMDLALDGPDVYWISPDGAIRRGRTTTDGGDATMFLAGAGATSLAIVGAEVLFTSDDGQLRAASIAGGAARVVATGLRLARELAADERDAFWVDTETGEIATVPIASGAAGGTPRVVASASPSSRIAVCPNAVWIANPARRSIERWARP